MNAKVKTRKAKRNAKVKTPKAKAKTPKAKRNAKVNKSKTLKTKTLKTKRGRKPGWSKYNLTEQEALASLLKTHGIKGTINVMADPDSKLRNKKVFPETCSLSYFVLKNIAKKFEVELPSSRRSAPTFNPNEQEALVSLLKTHGITGTMKIMADPDSKLRNKKIFPEARSISYSVLRNIGKKYKLRIFRGRPKGWSKYDIEAQKQLAELLKIHGVPGTMKIMRAKESDPLAKERLELQPMNVSPLVLHRIARQYKIKLPTFRRGREPGWSKYTKFQEAAMGKLLQKYGQPTTIRILKADEHDELSALRPKKQFPEPVYISASILSKIIYRDKIKVPKSTRGRQKGWAKYKGSMAKYMIRLAKKYDIKRAVEILTAQKGPDVKLRNRNLVPKPLQICNATLIKLVKTGVAA